jgi:hypothetical protein
VAVAWPSLLSSLKQNALATAVELGPLGATKAHQNQPGLLGPLGRQFSDSRDGEQNRPPALAHFYTISKLAQLVTRMAPSRRRRGMWDSHLLGQ